ncbi:12533_t:CDS:1, partial [Cetraspora pellucida]
WDCCESFLKEWAKKQGFRVIKDQVHQEEGIVRRWAFICTHSQNYDSNSKKNTGSKKMRCPFLVNVSYPKINNPENLVFITKFTDEHNHKLDRLVIEFEESKKFTNEILEDIKFMTVLCKFGVTAQRKFLENKYPLHPIYSKDLYTDINKFHSTYKSLLNDAAQVSNWLNIQKEHNLRWFIARGWDDDKVLTHWCWMTPMQIKN